MKARRPTRCRGSMALAGRGPWIARRGSSQVIGSLYDAAAEPERWPAALTAAADLLGAVGAQFFLWDKQRNTTPSRPSAGSRGGNEAYLRYYSAFDTRRQALERVPVGKLVRPTTWSSTGAVSEERVLQRFSRPLRRALRCG